MGMVVDDVTCKMAKSASRSGQQRRRPQPTVSWPITKGKSVRRVACEPNSFLFRQVRESPAMKHGDRAFASSGFR